MQLAARGSPKQPLATGPILRVARGPSNPHPTTITTKASFLSPPELVTWGVSVLSNSEKNYLCSLFAHGGLGWCLRACS